MGQLDEAKLGAFGVAMATALNGAATALMLSIGHQVGLFDTMAAMAPSTSAEIAARAGLDERYVREWLGALACAGVVEYDGRRDLYVLPAEHAALTTRAAGAGNVAVTAQLVAVLGSVEAEIVERFRTGGGVPYPAYGRFSKVMSELSAAAFDQALVPLVLPLVPGAVEGLTRGIEVADVATGSGHAVNVLARAFPASRFVGYDLSEEGIGRAREEAAAWGLANARFELRDVAELGERERFDLVTTFDAVHDQARPAQVVSAIYAALKPGGHFLCADIAASSHLGENLSHPMGALFYAVSCMHCMSVSLAYGGPGLGAMWGVQQAKALLCSAGFEELAVHALAEDPVNNFYVARRPDPTA